jgi:type II secretory pathway pseudopilin PulG
MRSPSFSFSPQACDETRVASGVRASGREAEAGFTLLELIIAFTILALMAGVLFFSFRMGMNSYQKSQTRIEEEASKRVLQDEIKRQLGSVFPLRPAGAFLQSEDQAPQGMVQPMLHHAQTPLFEGFPDSVTFITVSPLVLLENPGLSVVRYGPAEDEFGEPYFGAMEARFTGIDSFNVMVGIPRGKPLALIENVSRVSFEYYGYDSQNSTYGWYSSWSGQETGLVPSAVRIHCDQRTIVVPINADSYPTRSQGMGVYLGQ